MCCFRATLQVYRVPASDVSGLDNFHCSGVNAETIEGLWNARRRIQLCRRERIVIFGLDVCVAAQRVMLSTRKQ